MIPIYQLWPRGPPAPLEPPLALAQNLALHVLLLLLRSRDGTERNELHHLGCALTFS